MSNHLRCPLCGRNVRYSTNAKKVVRHKQLQAVDEPWYEVETGSTVIRQRAVYGGVCPTSGMREWEVRQLSRTMLAFGQDVYYHKSNQPTGP